MISSLYKQHTLSWPQVAISRARSYGFRWITGEPGVKLLFLARLIVNHCLMTDMPGYQIMDGQRKLCRLWCQIIVMCCQISQSARYRWFNPLIPHADWGSVGGPMAAAIACIVPPWVGAIVWMHALVCVWIFSTLFRKNLDKNKGYTLVCTGHLLFFLDGMFG